MREIEISLRETLHRKVRIRRSPRGGVLELEFYSHEDLMELAGRLAAEE